MQNAAEHLDAAAPQDASFTMLDATADAVSVADTASFSGALQFDGINDLVELPTPLAAGANETAFSVEVWFKTTAPTGCMGHHGSARWHAGLCRCRHGRIFGDA